MSLSSCCNPCPTVETVNIPGTPGAAGDNGENGLNAYTTTSANFVVPAVGANVSVTVENATWMAVGQNVVADGPANFEVISQDSATSATLKFLGYPNDVAPGATITSGSTISPAGPAASLDSLTVYASGTAYTVTATSAAVTFGTTSPALTLTAAGTYLIFARANYKYNAATFAAVRTVTTKLRRTNNTPADLTNGSGTWLTDIITTLTYTAAVFTTPPVVYTTANADDAIALYADVSVLPSAGSLDITEASIVAIKIG